MSDKCECHGPNCSGPLMVSKLGRDVRTCTYHGELITKLRTMSLAQLEDLYDNVVWEKDSAPYSHKYPKYIEDARRLALCSDINSFHKHVEDVYKGTYDYRNH